MHLHVGKSGNTGIGVISDIHVHGVAYILVYHHENINIYIVSHFASHYINLIGVHVVYINYQVFLLVSTFCLYHVEPWSRGRVLYTLFRTGWLSGDSSVKPIISSVIQTDSNLSFNLLNMHKRKFDSLRLTYLTNKTTCKFEYIYEYVHVDFFITFWTRDFAYSFFKKIFLIHWN